MKRWLRFSVRTLLVLVTATAMGLGIFVTRVEQQRRTVRAVLVSGGHVAYDFEYNSGGKTVTSTVPDWLLRRAGHDYFHEVWVVHLNWPECDGSGLNQAQIHRLLKSVPRLRRLRLGGADDETLGIIGQMKELEQLDLYCASAVSDRGVAKLESLQKLTSLQICDSPLTDQGVASIAKLNALTRIMLENATGVTDRAVPSLAGLASVQQLAITGSQIGDKGAMDLIVWKQFRSVKLDGPRLTDEGKYAIYEYRFIPSKFRPQVNLRQTRRPPNIE